MSAMRLVPMLALAIATPLAAQDVSPALHVRHATWSRGLVHYGKWVVAAAAVTFTALGAHEHQNSNAVFGELLDRCRANTADCTLGPDGKYIDAASEQLYQTSLHFDRRARLRLLLGQASLLAGAGLFLADLRHHATGPDNIPYRGLELWVAPRGSGAQVGVRVPLTPP